MLPQSSLSHPKLDKSTYDYMWRSCVAGGVAGCFAKTISAPLDRVKILFQGFNPAYVKHVGTPFGVFKAAQHIHFTHGASGLFQGHSAMLMRIFPSAAIRFMSYEQLKRLLIPTKDQSSPFRHFLCGSLAGNIAVLATYPLEVVRSRLAFEIRSHHPAANYGIAQTCRTLYREGGNSMRGFYRGFGATMIGVVPYAGSAFMSYQMMKEQCLSNPAWIPYTAHASSRSRDALELNIVAHLLIGAISGLLGQTASYPFDTVRHRMQLEGVATAIPRYRNTFMAIWTILRSEGVRSLYVGLTINYWKTIPANSVAFVSYDYMKSRLGIDAVD